MPVKTKTRTRTNPRIFVEIANFLATCPTREQVLSYHPSARVQKRASELLRKNREDEMTDEDREEMEEFGHAEALMRMIKAKLRGAAAP